MGNMACARNYCSYLSGSVRMSLRKNSLNGNTPAQRDRTSWIALNANQKLHNASQIRRDEYSLVILMLPGRVLQCYVFCHMITSFSSVIFVDVRLDEFIQIAIPLDSTINVGGSLGTR